ncbi:TetR/AcrR family transcriptional regulator [Microtetraspora glauca]|uniref:TetR/AcrR family transcriptional regulator n=1 Tax=Microtetraspora glauca TaxID=1996 RepID=A0ABV3GMA0_MICGL
MIAECTCRVVSEEGLEGVTLRRVAEELGCTTGLVTHYFPAKEDLLEAALRSAYAELARLVEGGGPLSCLDDWVDRFVDILPTDETRRRFWRVLVAFQAAAMNSERLAEVQRHYADHHKPWLRRLVRRALPDAAAPDSVDSVTEALWVLADGVGIAAAVNPEHLPPEHVATVMKGAWRGLVGSPIPTRSVD